jgi:outer membrane lipoprotein
MNVVVLVLFLTLAGCASDIPRPIREAPEGNIPLAQALQKPESHRGVAVRWGGAISSVENRRDETWIEVVERPLDEDGQPRNTDTSAGRFLARVQGFLDPAIFAPKRLVTVSGVLEGVTTRTIGQHPYTYPVVHVEHVYLWPIPPKIVHHYYHSPYWYDPWYPWGYPYPYYRRPH